MKETKKKKNQILLPLFLFSVSFWITLHASHGLQSSGSLHPMTFKTHPINKILDDLKIHPLEAEKTEGQGKKIDYEA